MAIGLRFFSLVVIVFVITICNDFSSTLNYNIALTDIKCNYNKKYAVNASCALSEPAPSVGAGFEMQMKSAVKDLRIDLEFYLERSKKFILIFKAPDLDVCVEFHKKQAALYVELFKEMTQRAGKWPKCPIEADFYYKFTNITPSAEYLPPFLPQVAFKMIVAMKDKAELIMSTSIFGKVVHKQKAKKSKKH